MYCEHCGSEIKQGARFCENCGAPAVQKAPDPVEQPYLYQSQQEYTMPPVNEAPQQPQLPMKWFKFLTKFALIAGVVINLISSLTYFTGTIEAAEAFSSEDFYEMYPGMRFCDIFMGLSLIAISVIAVMARNKLAKFKVDGPKYLFITYAVNIATSVAYMVWSAVVKGSFDFSISGGIIAIAAVIALNYIYFKKRSHLFVNQ